MSAIEFPVISVCRYGKHHRLRTRIGAGYEHIANVWTGSEWIKYRHGTKRCIDCGARYKLNYVAERGGKPNILTENDLASNPVLLLHQDLGFTYNSMQLFWNRCCRAALSAGAEASSIYTTFPDVMVQQNKTHWRSLARNINRVLFCFLRLQEKVFDFNIEDPVPDSDPVYGVTKTGLYIIFNAARDDPCFVRSKNKLDVVTDGNYQLCRNADKKEKNF